MKRIILCEGKTDAILISYFLIRKFGWSYIRKKTEIPQVELPVDKNNEELNWYNHPKKPNQELAIWSVGGINQLPNKLKNTIERTQIERTTTNRFERIVLFFDRDQRGEAECVQLIEEWTTTSNLELIGDMQLGRWVDATIELIKTPPESYQLSILPIVLPPDGKGALETFLIDSIKGHSNEDRQLVDEAWEFINRLPDEPYLSKRRFHPKACLGAILSVMSPNWVFAKLHERLTRVKWENIELVLNAYKKLEGL